MEQLIQWPLLYVHLAETSENIDLKFRQGLYGDQILCTEPV